jgi:ATP-grasp domain
VVNLAAQAVPELENVPKTFLGGRALDNVSLELNTTENPGLRSRFLLRAGGFVDGRAQSQLAAEIWAVADKHDGRVMIQDQAAPGFELMLSALGSPKVGPAVTVRLGGVLAGLMKESSHPRRPVDERAATRRAATVDDRASTGHLPRRAPLDLAAVATLAGILANALSAGDFEFIELNPVIVAEQGASVVDILGGNRHEDPN